MTRPARNLFDLSGRTAIVTGGATHLGRSMAVALADAGATTYIASRDEDACTRAAGELSSDGSDVRGRRCDVTSRDDVDALVAEVADGQGHGHLDVIVCNAGGGMGTSSILDITDDSMAKSMELNLLGTFHCIQAATRVMVIQRAGSIITIGPTHGSLGSNPQVYVEGYRRAAVDYHSSKAAVINLTRAFATELGYAGVRANCISPGQIPGPHVSSDQVASFARNTPLQRVGRPQDLDGMVTLLASDASAWITGQNFVVDGGWSAW